MTIEEALKSLSGPYKIRGGSNEPTTTLYFDIRMVELFDALNMALDALRAQQEAEKNKNGCKYCRDGEVIARDMCNDAVMIETDGRIHVLEGGDWECEINYCPMCGRRLRRPPVKEEGTK